MPNSKHSACLYACSSTCVRLRASICLSVIQGGGGGGGWSISFYKLIRVPPSPGVDQCFCLPIFLSALTPVPGLPQTVFLLCLKYDLFRKTSYTILNMLSRTEQNRFFI